VVYGESQLALSWLSLYNLDTEKGQKEGFPTMKYFIVSDVHGFYRPLITALENAGFDKENGDHTFVSLGDLLDRGTDTIAVLDFVNALDRKILIKGNHEDLLDDCLYREEFGMHDYHNGTVQTVCDLCGTNAKNVQDIFRIARKNKSWLNYRQQLIDFYEGDDFVFVHGWIPIWCNEWRRGMWNKARWLNGMEHYQTDRADNKTVFCGHWHTSWGHCHIEHVCSEFGRDANFEPFIDDGIVALDACTAHSGKVNCYVLER